MPAAPLAGFRITVSEIATGIAQCGADWMRVSQGDTALVQDLAPPHRPKPFLVTCDSPGRKLPAALLVSSQLKLPDLSICRGIH